VKSLVLFNNKGGVGKTTLTFNIAHMAARLGVRTVVLDYQSLQKYLHLMT
jgi:cellulose biosynthesis protein BcsQ